MKYLYRLLLLAVMCGIYSSCSVFKSSSHNNNAWSTVKAKNTSTNDLDMEIDQTGVTYTIDVSTPEGRLKLNKLSLHEAEKLALTEALMHYNCATLFNPQYTHLKKGKNILRVTVYGYPARYKKKY